MYICCFYGLIVLFFLINNHYPSYCYIFPYVWYLYLIYKGNGHIKIHIFHYNIHCMVGPDTYFAGCQISGVYLYLADYQITSRITGYCSGKVNFVAKCLITIQILSVYISVYQSKRPYACSSVNL